MRPRARTASTSAGSGTMPRSPVSRDHSRPPMKRADGTGSPKALTLIRVSRRGSSAAGRPPTAIATTQVPVETTANGAGWLQQVRQQRGVGIVDAADDRRGRVEAGRRRHLGRDRAEPVGGAAERRHPALPALGRRRGTRSCGACGFQRSVWQPSEVASEASDAAEPEGPVLRVGEDGGDARRRLGEAAELPEELRPEVQPRRQPRRAGLGEAGAGGVVGGGRARPGRRARSRAPAAPGRPRRRAAPRWRRGW